ncbi:MAG: hypothetical protein AABZ60_23160 [Planctomycetota bacterium]
MVLVHLYEVPFQILSKGRCKKKQPLCRCDSALAEEAISSELKLSGDGFTAVRYDRRMIGGLLG